MPVYVIDTLKPKNGLDFPVVEAVDVAVEGYASLADAVTHFATQSAIDAINTALGTKANTSDVNTATASLQAQIDQIAQTAGTGTADTEIGQARVGADGTSYNNLKARLDAETNQRIAVETTVNTKLSYLADYNVVGTNLYNVNDTDQHKMDAYIVSSSGGLQSLDGWEAALIDIEGGRKISTNKLENCHVCFFSQRTEHLSQKSVQTALPGYISGYTGNVQGYTTPANAVQMSISHPIGRQNIQVEYGEESTPYEPYEMKNAILKEDVIVNSGLRLSEAQQAAVNSGVTSQTVTDTTTNTTNLSNLADYNVTGKNLYNENDTDQHKEDVYIVYNNGSVQTLADWNAALVDIEGGRKISTRGLSGCHVCFFSQYNEHLSQTQTKIILKGYISGYTGNVQGYDTPANAVQMSISYPDGRQGIQIEYSEESTDYEPYVFYPAKLKDNVVAAIGITKNHTVYRIYADESGDFEDLKSCLNSITESSADNTYEVQIYPGEYDIASLYEDYTGRGLDIPDYVTIKGIGDKNNIILKAELDTTSTSFSLLNPKNVFCIENVTMYAKNCRYVIHDDWQSNGSYAEHTLRECILIGENCQYGSVYGSGLKGNAKWTFENCLFDANKASAAGGVGNCLSVHNNVNVSKSSTITFQNCRLRAHDVSTQSTYNTLRLLSMTNNSENGTVYVHLYGNYIDGISMNENDAAQYGAGCSFYVDGYYNVLPSYAGATSVTSTDGVDYSDRYQLI